MSRQIGDAESRFVVINTTPDMCDVNGQVVPFDIFQELASEKDSYSPDVTSRGHRVLMKGSVVRQTIGNMGKGIISGVAQGSGHHLIIQGEPTVTVNGEPVAAHEDFCIMNVDV